MGHGIEWLLVLACLLHQHSEIRDLVSCPDAISEYGVCGSQDGQTALHVASRVVDRIHQLAPVCRVQDGQTALHVASRVGDVGTVQLVISRGADVDAATADGYTALHIAAKEGHDDVAHALLELGASTTPTTKARRHTVLVASGRIASDTIRYDTRCYFNRTFLESRHKSA